jgi:uncharacterized membrane protein YdjX (TVP38/TMEM64 family)
MGIYSLTLLVLGILIIGLIFARLDITKPKTLVAFLLSLLIFLASFFLIHHHLQKTCAIIQEGSFADFRRLMLSWGAAAPVMSILLMILQAVIAPLPAFLITASNGLVFGVYWGTVISWVGAMLGAFVSFMISRLFFESFAKRLLGEKKSKRYLDRMSSKYGFKVVLIARLLPFISFDLISYVAGLSTIKIRSFLLATGIGMLPATVVYTVVGYEMENLKKYSEGLFTFSIVAVLALILIWTIQKILKRSKNPSVTKNDGDFEG